MKLQEIYFIIICIIGILALGALMIYAPPASLLEALKEFA